MFYRGPRDPRDPSGTCRVHGMPILPSAANAASATDANRLCHTDQGGQIMKKLATLISGLALVTAFAAGAEAKVTKVSAAVFFADCLVGVAAIDEPAPPVTVTVSTNTVVTGTSQVVIKSPCTVAISNGVKLTLNSVDLVDDNTANVRDLIFVAGNRTVLTIRNDPAGVDGLNVNGDLTYASGTRSKLDISGSTLSGLLINLSAGGGFSRTNIAKSTLTSGSSLFIETSRTNNGGTTVVEDSVLASAAASVIVVSASLLANNGTVSVMGGTLDGVTTAVGGGIKIQAGFNSKTTAKFIDFFTNGTLAALGEVVAAEPAAIGKIFIVIDGTMCKSIGNDPDVDCL